MCRLDQRTNYSVLANRCITYRLFNVDNFVLLSHLSRVTVALEVSLIQCPMISNEKKRKLTKPNKEQ